MGLLGGLFRGCRGRLRGRRLRFHGVRPLVVGAGMLLWVGYLLRHAGPSVWEVTSVVLVSGVDRRHISWGL